MWQEVLVILNWLALNVPWEAILALPVISAILLVPKRFVKRVFVHSELIMILLVGVAGLVTSVGHYLSTTPELHPSIVALQGLAISFGTQPVYYALIKPLSRKAGAWFVREISKASASIEARSAIVPEGGLPVTATPTPLDDFSR